MKRRQRQHSRCNRLCELNDCTEVGRKSFQKLVVSSSRVGLVHERDFARHSGPLEFAAKRFIASLTLVFFPFEKLVCESKVWLDDNVQSSCSYKTAADLLVTRLEGVDDGAYYARGNERPISFITSAIHIVAERDTPTRQWTRVASPAALPASMNWRHRSNSFQSGSTPLS